MTPDTFMTKWKASTLKERSASQSHFNDLCELLAVDKPTDVDQKGEWYCFERGASKTAGGEGWADVWKRGHFGWEYKGRRKDHRRADARRRHPGKIMMIVRPVIIEPLWREWEAVKARISKPRTSEKSRRDQLGAFLERLRSFRVLDPACGSGNFLYLALLSLKEATKGVFVTASIQIATRSTSSRVTSSARRS
jgi:hypothetical protein